MLNSVCERLSAHFIIKGVTLEQQIQWKTI